MNRIIISVGQLILKPRSFFSKLGPEYATASYFLLAVAGVIRGLSEYFDNVMGTESPKFHPLLMMAAVIILSCLFMLIVVRLWAILLNATSSIFNSNDEAYELRMAASFALIPSIIADAGSMLWDDLYFRSIVTIVCAIWLLALYIIMVATIKQISYLKAFLSVLMAAVVIIGAAFLVQFIAAMLLERRP